MAPKIERDLNQIPDHRPLYERIQEWVFRMDVAGGVPFFRIGMFTMLLLLVVLLYTGTQFFGLNQPQAMDLAQLGRNLAAGRGYVTRVLRPFDLGYLSTRGVPTVEVQTQRTVLPELWTPPMYPLMLSVLFRGLKPQVELTDVREKMKAQQQLPGDWRALETLYNEGRGQALRMDRFVVLAGWLCFLAGLVLVYFMARELFDQRVAALSVFMYLFCDPLLSFAVSGLPVGFMALLFTGATYGVFKAEMWQTAGKPVWWVNAALGGSALLVGVGTLTQYPFAGLIVPLLVYVGVSFKATWRQKAVLCVALFALVLLPWVARNWAVSRTYFGLSRYGLIEAPLNETIGRYKPGELQRHFSPDVKVRWSTQVLRVFVNFHNLYEVSAKEVGANFLAAFFFASLLHRYRRDEVFRLRRFVFWGLLACGVWMSVAGPPQYNFFSVFLPLIIIYGAAFFYVLFERLQYQTRMLRWGMVAVFAALNAVPFVLTILPPRAKAPYPPYDGGVAAVAGQTIREDELMVSDIPWAVAWYADRSAVNAPFEQGDFVAVNDNIRVMSAIYLTQATLLQLGVIDMLGGSQRFWTQLYQPPPPQFPLKEFRPLTPDGQQVLIGNRPR